MTRSYIGLSGYYKQPAIKACDNDPTITDRSVALLEKEEYALLLRMAMEPGVQGEWAKRQLALIQPEATIGPVDPYNSVSEADILNREDPKVIERLKRTYWFTLPAEEQDRRYEELKAYYEKLDKEMADKDRLARSGVGNQTMANILMGGSNMIVQAINTAAFGIPRTLGDWIAGPAPEGYVNPMDDPYGKKAGQIAGTFISIGLPMRFLNGVKTPGLVGKFSPTLLKSMAAGAISGTIEETMDAINDYRDDGKQSVGTRLLSVGINTVIAGAGEEVGVGGTVEGSKRYGEKPVEAKLKLDLAAEKRVELIRSNGLDNIEMFAKNTGLSIEEAKNLKSHMFLNEYELCHYDQQGLYYYKTQLTPDSEVVYAFTKAQEGELTLQEKEWFKKLVAHELAEKELMESGLTYRNPDSWDGIKFTNVPPGAHDLAPKQPEFGSFPEYEENVAKFYNLRWSELYD